MDPRLNVVTLAVRDLATSLEFYRDGLGLPGKIIGTEYLDEVSGACLWQLAFPTQGDL
jgi:catechol 2,3-dioxygenase-like lactoylglutathione lyase family enzyme